MFSGKENYEAEDSDEQEEQEEVAGYEWLRSNIHCQNACPAHTDVSGFISLIAEGKFDEAYLLNRRDNLFPGVLGRICPKPCEAACRRNVVDGPISVCGLKRSTSDLRSARFLPTPPPSDRTKPVAIVGAGPAGLACARDLRMLGYQTTIYDRQAAPGGMLLAGIPAWRLPRQIIKNEVDNYLRALGVEFRLNVNIGSDSQNSVEQLLQRHVAVFLAAGCQKPLTLNIPGEKLRGFDYGLDWLKKINLEQQLEALVGKRVVVIGAGFTAIDCCRTALRLGAKEVYLCYRRTQSDAPIDDEEIREAEKEGIQFVYLVSPVEIIGDDRNHVRAVKFVKNQVVTTDGKRSQITAIPGREFTQPCEIVLAATGQQAEFSWLPEQLQWEYQQRGQLNVDPNSWMTSWRGLFAGGDFVKGPRNVISAIADGRKAALAIHRYLGGKVREETDASLEEVGNWQRDKKYLNISRQAMPKTLLKKKQNLNAGSHLEKEVATGFSRDVAQLEASRCLKCMYNVIIDPELCILCGACEDICPEQAISLGSLQKLEGSSLFSGGSEMTTDSSITLDEGKCVRCGSCIDRCPAQAIEMLRFHCADPMKQWYVGTIS
ncbi:MAG: FAD-dependent oxidoreductase [Chloroflexota bacterium]|nr:FAD-dependent oxidoreductase [Chloroflexota bacterium]